MTDVGTLINGFRTFKATEYQRFKDLIAHVVQLEIKPKTMFICCSDLRIPPGKIFSSNPGELFIVRNLGALVPPYRIGEVSDAMAAIEYGVGTLEVDNVIVMGHAYCDAMKRFFYHQEEDRNVSEAVNHWYGMAKAAKEAVLKQLPDKPPLEQELAFEQEVILSSLKNLLAYPSVSKRVKNKSLQLYGWLFNIKEGMLAAFDPRTRSFQPVE